MEPNFIKYLTDTRARFTIKNRIAKNNVMSLYLLDQLFFFKSIIGLNQIFGGANSSYCRLNFENIRIIIYYFKKSQNFGGAPLHIALLWSLYVGVTINLVPIFW